MLLSTCHLTRCHFNSHVVKHIRLLQLICCQFNPHVVRHLLPHMLSSTYHLWCCYFIAHIVSSTHILSGTCHLIILHITSVQPTCCLAHTLHQSCCCQGSLGRGRLCNCEVNDSSGNRNWKSASKHRNDCFTPGTELDGCVCYRPCMHVSEACQPEIIFRMRTNVQWRQWPRAPRGLIVDICSCKSIYSTPVVSVLF